MHVFRCHIRVWNSTLISPKMQKHMALVPTDAIQVNRIDWISVHYPPKPEKKGEKKARRKLETKSHVK